MKGLRYLERKEKVIADFKLEINSTEADINRLLNANITADNLDKYGSQIKAVFKEAKNINERAVNSNYESDIFAISQREGGMNHSLLLLGEKICIILKKYYITKSLNKNNYAHSTQFLKPIYNWEITILRRSDHASKAVEAFNKYYDAAEDLRKLI